MRAADAGSICQILLPLANAGVSVHNPVFRNNFLEHSIHKEFAKYSELVLQSAHSR
jgi:hypothetical protein